MSRAHFSPLALGDLHEVLDYIARDKPHAAVAFVDKLEAFCHGLADRPASGTSCSHLSTGLRCVSFSSYVIYFRPTKDGVEIVRIVHGARDTKRLFGQEESP
jgi:toxin ParE1/3/4